ncbi:MAG: hypothetical protein EBU90_09980 [Proteobacteria bacterium]|nr:hypothetical protein [Pseudomonadota bacterium]NBP14916.1 hypothetical protein [bacterium]
MPLGFPSNPSPGDTYVIGSTTYQWNGSAWIIQSSQTSVLASQGTFTGIVTITTTTNSTSTDTGALIVYGGVGIGRDVNIGGTLTVYGSIIGIGVGTAISISTGTFDTIFVSSTTNAINTQSGAVQVVGGVGIGGDVYVGGVLYAAGGTVLTTASFTAQLNQGDDIRLDVVTATNVVIINNTSTLQSVTTRGSTTTQKITVLNTTQSTSTDTGALVVSGGVGIGGRINAESIRIADAVLDSTQTLVNTTSSTIIDSFDIGDFRSAKYLIQIDEGTGAGADFELIEILLVGDNSGNVWATEYGVVTSNGYLGDFNAEYTGTTVSLYFTAYAATNKTIKVLRTGMAA